MINSFCIIRSREQIALQILHENMIVPDAALRTYSIEGAVRLAAAGFGVCFVSENHLKHIALDIDPVLFSVGHFRTEAELLAVYRKGAYLPQYARDYIEIARNAVR